MYLGLQIVHKRKTDTRRRDPSDWENFPPTSVPTPVLVSVKRTVKILPHGVYTNQKGHSQVQRTCGGNQCQNSMLPALTDVNCDAYSTRTIARSVNTQRNERIELDSTIHLT